MEIKNSKYMIRLPLLLCVAIAAGILIGANMTSPIGSKSDVVSSIFKFREILNYVDRNYVDEVETDELVETAISSMLEKLDPHTVYLPAKEHEYSKSELEGNFDGIGIEFNIFRDTIYVVAPLSGGPSEEIGLLSGDKIVKVDGENVAGIGIKNRGVFDRLRGPKGSEVKVSIKRRNVSDLLKFSIVRDKIPQFSMDAAYMVDHEIGYIKISRFSATTYDEFKEGLDTLTEVGMKKLVLDLTGNPGGYMDKAIKMADEFLSGDPMIVFTKGKELRYNQEHRAGKDGNFEKGGLIVLIDEGSASASEIVSGAVQDNDRGLIVGRRSFGKGLVQLPMELSDGSELRLTISRYYTPSGRSIQKSYENGQKDYYQDGFHSRYSKGEMFSADSIKLNDSLIFETAKGRTVYGGGGIVPDYFVALDTVGNSAYLNRLFTSSTIREYALEYSQNNREKLENRGFEKFKDNFSVTKNMLNDLVDLGKRNGLDFNEEQFNHSKKLIKTYVKAQIARGIWKSDGFYPIYNETNEIFQRALQLFDEADQLASK
ncbi:MAG: PDZ domain-containing protein [Cyclobacteriaceae bacterium]